MKTRENLIAYAYKYKGEIFKVSRAYLDNEKIEPMDYINENDNVITIFDEEYPIDILSKLETPPLVLFYEGDISLLKSNTKKIGIIGCDNCSNGYAFQCTLSLIKANESRNNTLISDNSLTGSYVASYKVDAKKITVLSCGINCNVSSNADLIISEYPGEIRSDDARSMMSARLIGALSKELNIIQAQEKSKEVAAINTALELGNKVKVLPYDIFNLYGSYNNNLIQQGAEMIMYKDLKKEKVYE